LAEHPEVERDLSLAVELGLTLAEFDRLPADERELWIARRERDRETCKHCGNPISECSDPETDYYPFRFVCYATMEREAANAAYADLHEDAPFHNGTFTSWAKERSKRHPYRYNDGVTITVAGHDPTPWDKFTTEVNASPAPPASSGP
ncbi:MAG TPA: hypothetical protein VIP28_09500, partial [Nocardioides sp.]